MKKYSALLVGIAGFCWGLIGVFSKNLLSNGFSPIQITALRCLVAAIGLGIYLVIFDRDKLRIKIRDIYYFIGTGIFSIVFFNVCYFMTVDMVSLSVAVSLTSRRMPIRGNRCGSAFTMILPDLWNWKRSADVQPTCCRERFSA